jgi:hypothetical protein
MPLANICEWPILTYYDFGDMFWVSQNMAFGKRFGAETALPEQIDTPIFERNTP